MVVVMTVSALGPHDKLGMQESHAFLKHSVLSTLQSVHCKVMQHAWSAYKVKNTIYRAFAAAEGRCSKAPSFISADSMHVWARHMLNSVQ